MQFLTLFFWFVFNDFVRFLRPLKSYNAPSNAAEKIQDICSTLKIPNKQEYSLKSLEEKCKFLQACFVDFQHGVPNSQVHELKTVGKSGSK